MTKYRQQSRVWIFIIGFLLSSTITAFSQASDIQRLKTGIEQANNDSVRVVLEIKLSREIHREAHDEDSEYLYAKKAIELALCMGDTLLNAIAFDNLGLLYRFHRHYDQAFSLHVKAYKLVVDKNVPPINKMIFANNAGVAARYNGQYDQSIFYYMAALKIAEAENNLQNIAISSNGIGNALGSIPGRKEEALTYYLRSLQAEKNRHNSLGVAMNYLSISGYYIENKNYDKAREYLRKLLKINQEREDEFGLAITYEFYGICYLKEGRDLPRAKTYFLNALHRYEDLNNEDKVAELYRSLGDIFWQQNKNSKAEEYYLKSLSLAKENGSVRLTQEVAQKLSEIFKIEKQYAKALTYHELADFYEDSIDLAEQSVKIEALTRKYNFEQKEDRINLLKKDKALQKAILKNQKQKLGRRQLVIVLLLVGFVMLLIIFFLQYRNHRIKKKTNAQLVRNEKEKTKAIYERNLAQAEILITRLRITPHFLFNSLNAITYLVQSEQNKQAVKYLKVFSRYTRMVLETSKQQVIELSEELKLSEYYLILEENRFEEDFNFSVSGDMPDVIDGLVIPPLLLQPFLENAIWHGLLKSKKKHKEVKIEIISQDKFVKISIDDNGIGRFNRKKRTSLKKNHKSMGMEIVKERIELYNKTQPGRITHEIIDKKNPDGTAKGTRIELNLFLH